MLFGYQLGCVALYNFIHKYWQCFHLTDLSKSKHLPPLSPPFLFCPVFQVPFFSCVFGPGFGNLGLLWPPFGFSAFAKVPLVFWICSFLTPCFPFFTPSLSPSVGFGVSDASRFIFALIFKLFCDFASFPDCLGCWVLDASLTFKSVLFSVVLMLPLSCLFLFLAGLSMVFSFSGHVLQNYQPVDSFKLSVSKSHTSHHNFFFFFSKSHFKQKLQPKIS